MRLPNTNQFPYNSLVGYQVHILSGTVAPDGDGYVEDVDFAGSPVGTLYIRKVTANNVEKYVKLKDDKRDDDWLLEHGAIVQFLDISDFTDGGGATGTVVLNGTVPAGAIATRSYFANVSDATGETSLTAQVGDGTDADRYSTGTPSVATAAALVSMGAISGTAIHVTAVTTPTVTLTEAADFGVVSAWSGTVVLEYTGIAL